MNENEKQNEELDWFDEIALKDVFNEIVIDDEFKNRLWKLEETEYDNLKESLLKEGCKEPLILWNNIIVDGHNRYEICKAFDIPFKTRQKEFESRSEVLKWIDKNQLTRRNLLDWQRSLIRGRISKTYKQEPGGDRKSIGQNVSLISQESAAKELGTTTKTLQRAEKFLDSYEDIERNFDKETADKLAANLPKQDLITIGKLNVFEQEPLVKQFLNNDKLTLNQIKTNYKKKKIEQLKTDIDSGKIEMPKGKYQVIMMDVPWPYGTSYDAGTRRVGNPYPEMSLDEIYNLNIPSDDDCILFFWTTHKFLEESFKIVKHYGFNYKGTIVWNKDVMGMGSTLRMQCEFCLLCFKGNPKWPLTDMRDIISEKRREHSRKPEILYNIITDNLIGNKLDYFSRTERPGWKMLGYKEFDLFEVDSKINLKK